MFEDLKDYLTVKEVAEALRININGAYTLVNTGRLLRVKVGSKWFIPKWELINFFTHP